MAPNGKTLAGETTNVRACVARDPARVKVWSARPERWLAPRALNRWNEEDDENPAVVGLGDRSGVQSRLRRMTMRTLIVIVTGLRLVLGWSLVHAQSDCRGQCDLMLTLRNSPLLFL